MPPTFELIVASLLLFLLLTGVLLPLGQLLLPRLLGEKLPQDVKLLLSFGLSIGIYSALTATLVILSVPNFAIQLILGGIVFIAATLYLQILFPRLRSRDLSTEEDCTGNMCTGEICSIAGFGFLYLLLTIALTAFPNATVQDISALTTERITSLPIDNLIPYNISRYLQGRINPNDLDVVPNYSGGTGWKLGERGPLGGVFAATISLLLGTEERNGWLATSPGPFFVYQFTLSYLNLLSLLGCYLITRRAIGRRAALIVVALLTTNYFYLLNIIFSWPKMLAAYFSMAAVFLWTNKALRARFTIGLFLGLAMLSHDMAMFTNLGLISYFAISVPLRKLFQGGEKLGREQLAKNLSGILQYAAGFLLPLLPWKIAKSFYLTPSPQLLFMHLFCDTQPGIENTPLSIYVPQYLAEHPLTELLSIRISNLFFPFNLGKTFTLLAEHWRDPILLINLISMEMFLRFLPAIGLLIVPIFAFAALHLLRSAFGSDTTLRWTLPYLLAGFGALPWYALAGGCAEYTVNHHWVYAAFLATALLVGGYVASSRFLIHLLFAVGIAISVGQAAIYIFLHSSARPLLHGSNLYFTLIGAIAILLTAIAINLWRLSEPRKAVPSDRVEADDDKAK